MSSSTLEHDHPRPAAAAGVAPLWAVLVFTWANSFASGSTFSGIFFITKSAYEFSSRQNLLLGLLMGVTYVAGALGAGPTLRRIARHEKGSPRNTLVALMLLGAGLCLLPVLPWYLTPEAGRKETQWSVWLFVGFYSALSGALWPIVESFLSGGRAGHSLRAATGRFNVTWSSALVVALLAMSPFIENRPMVTPALCAGVHLASLALLVVFPARPGAHGHDHAAVPASYAGLLRVHRVLLPVAYMVMYTMNPILPTLFVEQLKVPASISVLCTATWQITRVGVFALLDRWHGWHGRWMTATVAPALLLLGFAATILSPTFGGVPTAIVGLIAFGFGAAAIYTGALYYALEVGAAEVEAGGMHEAMIGVGYTLGPVCGLVPPFVFPTATGNGPVLAMVSGLAGVGLVAAWRFRLPRGGLTTRAAPAVPDIHIQRSSPTPAPHPAPTPARSS